MYRDGHAKIDCSLCTNLPLHANYTRPALFEVPPTTRNCPYICDPRFYKTVYCFFLIHRVYFNSFIKGPPNNYLNESCVETEVGYYTPVNNNSRFTCTNGVMQNHGMVQYTSNSIANNCTFVIRQGSNNIFLSKLTT